MNKGDGFMYQLKIRHIATSYNSAVIAAGEFERQVHVFNIQSGKKINEFETVLDFGATRLAISEDGLFCAAGSYSRDGIAMYKVSDGRVLWQRKDLKKVQYISFNYWDNNHSLLAFFDNKKGVILDRKTGDTVKILGPLDDIIQSHFRKIQLLDKYKLPLKVVDSTSNEIMFKIPRTTFAVLDGIFTPASVVISESGGCLTSYSLDNGKMMWKYEPEKGHHVLNVSYCGNTNQVFGVDQGYSEKARIRNTSLICFNNNSGKIEKKYLIKNYPGETGFALKGTRLISSEGEIIDTSNGKVVNTLWNCKCNRH